MDDFYERLGGRIRAIRKAHGVTQEQVAERLQLNRTTIVNIERGRQRLAVHQLVELASVLGCEPAALLVKDTDEEIFVERIRAERHRGREHETTDS